MVLIPKSQFVHDKMVDIDSDSRQKVLIVDDEIDMATMLEKIIRRRCDCDTRLADSAEAALDLLRGWHPDVILTDVRMSGMDGMSLLRRVKEFDPNISVIIMTGYGTIEMAVDALKQGVYDFFQKPFDNERVVLAVQRSLERTRLLRENKHLQDYLDGRVPYHGFIGKSRKLRQVMDLIARVADTDVTVLIRGESGTGKELAAKALHSMSKRADRKMVTVNCPALPELILESELFGYVKGAFTGAVQDKKGLFLAANHSTILLDEIGDIPMSLQTKLLRVLQEKEIMPLGQTRTYEVDVRVVASTNQDLEEKISQGEFREDLYYRLNVVTIVMPSLKEIPEDIPVLAQYFLNMYARKYEKPGTTFSPEAIECMLNREWKGNVRELQNTIKRGVLLCENKIITPANLFADNGNSGHLGPLAVDGICNKDYRDAKDQLITRFSRMYLTEALKNSNGNVTLAAAKSGLERQAFQRLMRRYGLKSSDFKVRKNN